MKLSIEKQIEEARTNFEMEVEAACLETQVQAKDIAKAIGEVSITEAKEALIKIFGENLMVRRHHETFRSKQ